jgi:hypothetical protein
MVVFVNYSRRTIVFVNYSRRTIVCVNYSRRTIVCVNIQYTYIVVARNDACFCPFCLNLTNFPTFLALQDKHNIRTLSLNIKFICTRCETDLKNSPKARYSACF